MRKWEKRSCRLLFRSCRGSLVRLLGRCLHVYYVVFTQSDSLLSRTRKLSREPGAGRKQATLIAVSWRRCQTCSPGSDGSIQPESLQPRKRRKHTAQEAATSNMVHGTGRGQGYKLVTRAARQAMTHNKNKLRKREQTTKSKKGKEKDKVR